jgi:MerR family copper efflux transcriptional regulator
VPDRLLTIGELAGRTGVATSALRYYDERGLLRPARRVSGRRRYSEAAVATVGAILLLREAGFTLDETRRLIASRGRSPTAWQRLARSKVRELEEQITAAEVARTAIEHALACPRDDIVDCPNFWAIVGGRLAGRPLAEVHACESGAP